MSHSAYRLSDFDYDLPEELIAQSPATERTASRLMRVAGSRIQDKRFIELPELLAPGDLMVFNDTRVIRSRLHGHRETGGRAELLVERIIAPDEAWMQLSASHPPKPGGRIALPGDASAIVIERDGRFFRLRFELAGPLEDYLDRYGEVPLPPYIAREPTADDRERYQTIYARHPGAVAAPTAGLHFDESMIDRLRSHGVGLAYLTLHVGAGTFQPVDSEDLARHRMHSERFTIPEATVEAIEKTRSAGRAVVAVGTTTLRALESAASGDDIRAGASETALFITPGHRFHVIDRLLTNFHLPRSTLLMLVSAFAGFGHIRRAYAHAVRERYRFFSYGDAMLLERDPDAPRSQRA